MEGLLAEEGHVFGELEVEAVLLLVALFLLPATNDARLHGVAIEQPANHLAV